MNEYKDFDIGPVTQDEQPNNDGENTANENAEDEHLKDFGSVTVKKHGRILHCLTIIGQIEGHYILPPQNKTTMDQRKFPIYIAGKKTALNTSYIQIMLKSRDIPARKRTLKSRRISRKLL